MQSKFEKIGTKNLRLSKKISFSKRYFRKKSVTSLISPVSANCMASLMSTALIMPLLMSRGEQPLPGWLRVSVQDYLPKVTRTVLQNVCTLVTGARTLLLASGLERFTRSCIRLFFRISSILLLPARLLMWWCLALSGCLLVSGVWCWSLALSLNWPASRQQIRFSGENVIFVGYPPNQQGFLVWCPGRHLGVRPKKIS